MQTIKTSKVTCLGHKLNNTRYELVQLIIMGKMAGKRAAGRREKSQLHNIREWTEIAKAPVLLTSPKTEKKYAELTANLYQLERRYRKKHIVELTTHLLQYNRFCNCTLHDTLCIFYILIETVCCKLYQVVLLKKTIFFTYIHTSRLETLHRENLLFHVSQQLLNLFKKN